MGDVTHRLFSFNTVLTRCNKIKYSSYNFSVMTDSHTHCDVIGLKSNFQLENLVYCDRVQHDDANNVRATKYRTKCASVCSICNMALLIFHNLCS